MMKLKATLFVLLGVIANMAHGQGDEEVLTYDYDNDCRTGGLSVPDCNGVGRASTVNCFKATSTAAPMELIEVSFWYTSYQSPEYLVQLWDGTLSSGPTGEEPRDSWPITPNVQDSNIVVGFEDPPVLDTNEFCVGVGFGVGAPHLSYVNLGTENIANTDGSSPGDHSYFRNGCDSVGFSQAGILSDFCIHAVVRPADILTTENTTSTSTATTASTTTKTTTKSTTTDEAPTEADTSSTTTTSPTTTTTTTDGTSTDPDSDGDGIPDSKDECPTSNMRDTIVIGQCDTNIANALDPNTRGCTYMDVIEMIAKETGKNRGRFVSDVADYSNALKKQKLISGKQKGRIMKCDAKKSK